MINHSHFELDKILNKIIDDRYKVISFDLFDTLIRRKVAAPEHVLWLIAEEFAGRIGRSASAGRIYEARQLAAHLAQHRARQKGKEEPNLEEIYETLAIILPEARMRINELMNLEIEEERRVLETYPFGARLYAAAAAARKRIIISSDQYLPIEFLNEVLIECGYTSHEKFLLSGDVGILKTTGSLYEWMPMLLGVDRSEILHIGDNPFVDVQVAAAKGLHSVLLPRSAMLAGHPGQSSASAAHATLGSYAAAYYLNRLADDEVEGRTAPHDTIDFVGYTFYGPLLCYLATWVTEPLRNGTIDRLWLLARDSQGLSKVVSLLYPELGDRIDYVYSSRRMLVYPTGALTGVEIFRHYGLFAATNPTVYDFLHRISTCEVDFVRLQHHFQPDDRVNDGRARAELKRRLDARCTELGLDADSDILTRLRQYYVDTAKGSERIGLFDLGWRGNLQRAMERLLSGTEIRFTGYYVGQIFEDEILKSHADSESYAFSYNFPRSAFEDIVYNIWPLELIFGGTEPSSIGVQRTEEGWRPIFETDAPHKAVTRALAERFQASAVRFVNDVVLPNARLRPHSGNVDRGVDLLRQFLARPSSSEAEALADLSWAMNIEDDGKPLIARPKERTGREISRARAASSWPAGFDVLQSEADLRSMRKYWKKREKRRALRDKFRQRIRKLFW